VDNGASYILYGPLLNGATTVILKEFLLIQILAVLEITEKHKVNQSASPTRNSCFGKKS
jgi:acyl-coenzyme A synthetase/AMP-(fatty) acid ligase